ncbi:3'(2'),5'-bisphosphate nucleotidase CysQ, partial [Enterobacter hormaechei]|nr:3'(2'),5'-bisphosphate nucleotidase CysQ [Enterobacter hormaechei]
MPTALTKRWRMLDKICQLARDAGDAIMQ